MHNWTGQVFLFNFILKKLNMYEVEARGVFKWRQMCIYKSTMHRSFVLFVSYTSKNTQFTMHGAQPIRALIMDTLFYKCFIPHNNLRAWNTLDDIFDTICVGQNSRSNTKGSIISLEQSDIIVKCSQDKQEKFSRSNKSHKMLQTWWPPYCTIKWRYICSDVTKKDRWWLQSHVGMPHVYFFFKLKREGCFLSTTR